MHTRLLPLLLVPLLAPPPSAASAPHVSARAWQGFEPTGALSFPELALPEVHEKANAGIAFSGGGVRAYSVTLGYLRGLLDIGVLQRVRYVSAVSGGAWASSVFSYHNPSAGEHVAQNDSALLGDSAGPIALSWAELDRMPAQSALHAATVGVGMTPLTGAQWVDKIQKVFLGPVGVPSPGNSSFTWDADSAAAIVARNPAMGLSREKLSVVRKREWGAPYLVMGVTLMGPLDSAPLSLDNRSYTVIDATPLYIGQGRRQPVTFNGRAGDKIPPVTLPVGGLLEPIALGRYVLAGHHGPAALSYSWHPRTAVLSALCPHRVSSHVRDAAVLRPQGCSRGSPQGCFRCRHRHQCRRQGTISFLSGYFHWHLRSPPRPSSRGMSRVGSAGTPRVGWASRFPSGRRRSPHPARPPC